MKKYLKMAYEDIKNRKKRSWLTMIGIVIGIIAVVSLITIGQGMKTSINEQFEMMGSDIIVIMPGGEGFMGFGISSGGKLTQHDIDLIKKVHGVKLTGGIVSKVAEVEFKDEIKYTRVSGLPTDEAQDIILNMQQVRIKAGQKRFKESDKYKAAVGYMIGSGDFFKREVKTRDKILIDGIEFEVVSVIDEIGNRHEDTSLWIPLETAREVFNESGFFAVMASVKSGFNPSDVADDIKERLRKDRGLKEGEEDFSVQTSEQLIEIIGSVLNIIQMVLISIAAISLLVGGVGIMNTMYTSVLERTRDIGIMKAIGARNIDIMFIFLLESGMLGLAGGGIGCILGIAVAKSVEIIADSAGFGMFNVYISPYLILGTLIFSFLIGVLSGILPAIKAMKLKVVDALHYE